MKRRILYAAGSFLAISIAVIGSMLLMPRTADVSAQQDQGWKVWVKTSPCSGRIDWITVAKTNPTLAGGGGEWTNADLIQTGNGLRCVRDIDESCSFAEATAEAEVVRANRKFLSYCCRNYSVWRNQQTGKMSVVVGKFATGGYGSTLVRGDLCCLEAEEISGIEGACSGGEAGGNAAGFLIEDDHQLNGTRLTYYASNSVEDCQSDCAKNPRCQGFTLIKAGTYNPTDPAMCYLMTSVTASSPAHGYISGRKKPGQNNPAGGTGAQRLNLAGTWSVMTKSTGDEGMQQNWTRTNTWQISNLGGGRWRVRQEINGQTYDETYSAVDVGGGRFRWIGSNPDGSTYQMSGTYNQSQFYLSTSVGQNRITISGTRQ